LETRGETPVGVKTGKTPLGSAGIAH
jgi:hypothetical protein